MYRAMGGSLRGAQDPELMTPPRRRSNDLTEATSLDRRRWTVARPGVFDTTSLLNTGNGGDTLGQFGKSYRP